MPQPPRSVILPFCSHSQYLPLLLQAFTGRSRHILWLTALQYIPQSCSSRGSLPASPLRSEHAALTAFASADTLWACVCAWWWWWWCVCMCVSVRVCVCVVGGRSGGTCHCEREVPRSCGSVATVAGGGSTREEAAPHPQAASDLVREHRKEPHTPRRTQGVPGLAWGPCKEGQGGSCPSPSGRACLGEGASQGAAYPSPNTGRSWFGVGPCKEGQGGSCHRKEGRVWTCPAAGCW
jgi:hypothetical protein